MTRTTRFIACLLPLLLLAFTSANAAVGVVPTPPKISAKGYILADFHSSRVIAEENADERMEPASLTKLMTAYAVFYELRSGNVKLDDQVRVSEKAWRTPGSRMFIEVGSRVPLEELLKGMIIQSGNDASVALAEHVAGSEEAFATLMNQHAHNLGLQSTHFVNSTGLPHPDHYTTPRDMSHLGMALIREFAEYYKWYAIKEMTYNGITQYNRNKLLWRDEDVDGIKTGHTESAGYCLVASAQRDGMRLVSVVMGTDGENSRARESQKLLGYGFRFFETHRLYEARDVLKTMRIWKGSEQQLPLGLADELYVTIPRGQYEKLAASLTVNSTIMAPARKGQQYGMVSVQLGESTLAQRPLIALKDVDEGGLWVRMVDNVMLWFE